MKGRNYTWTVNVQGDASGRSKLIVQTLARGLIEDGKCRICREQKEMVEHLLAGCKKIANSEYLTRHNRSLMVMVVAWAKEYHLVKKEVKCYKERWTRGHVLENARAKLL